MFLTNFLIKIRLPNDGNAVLCLTTLDIIPTDRITVKLFFQINPFYWYFRTIVILESAFRPPYITKKHIPSVLNNHKFQ